MNTPNTESGFDDPSLPVPPDQRPSVDPGPNHVIWKGRTGQIVPLTAEFWDATISDWSDSFFRGKPLTEVDMLTTLYRIPKGQSLPDYASETLNRSQMLYSEVINPLMAKVTELQEQIAYLRAKYIMHQDALCFYEENIRKMCLNPGDVAPFKIIEADCGGKALRALTQKPKIKEVITEKKWHPFSTVPTDTEVLVLEGDNIYKTSYQPDSLTWMRSVTGISLPSHWMPCPPKPQ